MKGLINSSTNNNILYISYTHFNKITSNKSWEIKIIIVKAYYIYFDERGKDNAHFKVVKFLLHKQRASGLFPQRKVTAIGIGKKGSNSDDLKHELV